MYDCKIKCIEIDNEPSLEINYLQELLEDCDGLHLVNSDTEEPYIVGLNISKVMKYNPRFGDNRICECGHPYHRHFDSYEDNEPVGCKYCRCYEFKEAVKKS